MGPELEPTDGVMVQVSIRGMLGDLELDLVARIDVRRLRGYCRYLASLGLKPPRRPLAFDRSAEGLPICPRHQVPMRERDKQGDKWYSHKVIAPDGQELWCRGYPGPESLGYDVEIDP